MSLVDKPVRGSRTGRPIMALLDLLGRRWSLRVLWELRGEPLSFRALQAACEGMSPSVLNQRLADQRYALTPRGRELRALFEPVSRWSESWARAQRERA